MDPRLLRLRIELFTAAQTLTGEDAEEFWRLIEEVQGTRVLYERKRSAKPAGGA